MLSIPHITQNSTFPNVNNLIEPFTYVRNQAATSQIMAAQLPPSTERVAHRLLSRAHPDNGHITFTWDELTDLLELSQGRIRYHLGVLKQRGIIHYSANGHVYITFRIWLESKTAVETPAMTPPSVLAMVEQSPRIESDHGRATIDHPRATVLRPALGEGKEISPETDCQPEIDHGRSEPARSRATIDHPRAAEPTYVCLFDPTPSIEEMNKHVEEPKSKPNNGLSSGFVEKEHELRESEFANQCMGSDLDVEESVVDLKQEAADDPEASCLALLIDSDVAIGEQVAAQWVVEHSPEWLERQVFAYLKDLEVGKVSGPGALFNRVAQRWNAPSLSEQDKQSDLYLRTHPVYAEKLARWKAELAEQERQWQAEATRQQQTKLDYQKQAEADLTERVGAPGSERRRAHNAICRHLRIDPALVDWSIEVNEDQVIVNEAGRYATHLERANQMIERYALGLELGRGMALVVQNISE
ncbi:transcriptional regulator [Chloroflexi bacterium TSY]|nr:transcriptional regulator [Chloroflexi bacterium TSY]